MIGPNHTPQSLFLGYITFTKLEPPDVATVYSTLNTKEVYAETLYPAESDIYLAGRLLMLSKAKLTTIHCRADN